MAARRISVDEFFRLGLHYPVIDVRSPSEYLQAHYPGAVSVPLFTDEERKIVGTTYKQQSRELAIKAGLDFFGPKMRPMVEQVENLPDEKGTRQVIVHCWRGGMRSEAVSWLLGLYGFDVLTLDGGYKAYRNRVLDILARPHSLRILSGYTGSGKTGILKELERSGQPVLDLEALAGHRGSAFGGLGMAPQCSNEQFENRLAGALFELSGKTFEDPAIWVESESSRIGNVDIHYSFFRQMKAAPRVDIGISCENRLSYIEQEYGKYDTGQLIKGVERIRKRLGGLEAQRAVAFLQNNDIRNAFSILLTYYDRWYDKGMAVFQPESLHIELPGTDTETNARIILEKIQCTKK